MNPQDDPLAKDLDTFVQSRKVAQGDAAAAAADQRDRQDRLVNLAGPAFADLAEAIESRVRRFNESSAAGTMIDHFANARNVRLRLGILEANVTYNPGQFADAFGTRPARVEFRLSRTSQTIGFDVMPPSVGMTYRPPQPQEEQFSLRFGPNQQGATWSGPAAAGHDALADYVVAQLVAYFKKNTVS